jgi:PTS system fructose-specific IIC component/PTS system mannose-specific IIC component
MKIVGVTKCPVGIAHTYLAAEKLDKAGKKLQHEIKVETQGAQGTENKLTDEEIVQADYVVIAADAAIEGEDRFVGKKVLKIPIKEVIRDAAAVINSLQNRSKVYEQTKTEESTEKAA